MGAGRERPLPDALRVPHPKRLARSDPDYDAIVAAHDAALDAGVDGYLDPRHGLFVFTAGYLWRRGYCCNTGCRHCPYLVR